LDPQFAEIHEHLSLAYDADGQYDKAIDEHAQAAVLRKNDPKFMEQWQKTMLSVLDKKGPTGLWQAELDWQKEHFAFDSYWMATINARLGNTNEVFSLLDRAYKEHNGGMLNLLMDYYWDGYRDHPRFKGLLTNIGFRPISGAAQ
jgi:tetratricopeptide (TPR) repeat protein